MRLTVVAVGSLKERYWRDALAEYAKRLSAYCRLEIAEVRDERTPESASAVEREKILQKEGARILEKLRERSFVIALDIRGRSLDSESFSAEHAEWERVGRGDVSFVIGGSLGLSEEVLARADCRLSFSRLTFPHQLARIILLEQLYRSYRIRAHAPYHK